MLVGLIITLYSHRTVKSKNLEYPPELSGKLDACVAYIPCKSWCPTRPKQGTPCGVTQTLVQMEIVSSKQRIFSRAALYLSYLPANRDCSPKIGLLRLLVTNYLHYCSRHLHPFLFSWWFLSNKLQGNKITIVKSER